MRTKQAEYKTLTNLYHSPTIIQINAYVNIICSGKILSISQYMNFVLKVHGLCTASTWLLYLKYTGPVLASNDSLFRQTLLKRWRSDSCAPLLVGMFRRTELQSCPLAEVFPRNPCAADDIIVQTQRGGVDILFAAPFNRYIGFRQMDNDVRECGCIHCKSRHGRNLRI